MCKNGQFQRLSTNMHVIQRLIVNYDTARHYLNFNQTDFFYIYPRTASHEDIVPSMANEFRHKKESTTGNV